MDLLWFAGGLLLGLAGVVLSLFVLGFLSFFVAVCFGLGWGTAKAWFEGYF